jgi:hypothetical protein
MGLEKFTDVCRLFFPETRKTLAALQSQCSFYLEDGMTRLHQMAHWINKRYPRLTMHQFYHHFKEPWAQFLERFRASGQPAWACVVLE